VKPLPALVLAAVGEHQPAAGAPILLACSGGLDSQVLLQAAASVLPASRLRVGHVHHGLQPEADDWLAFCEASARRLAVTCLTRRLPPLPERTGSGIEAWARRMRYRALAEMADEAGATLVMTAHHANDQIETHRLRSRRGAGALGLGAMRAGAPLPGAAHCLLLRPFLGVERRHILAYVRAHAVDWVDDPSNRDPRYARNRIRREIEEALQRDPQTVATGLAAIGGFQAAADAIRRQAVADLASVRLLLEPPRLPASLSRAALARLPAERVAEVLRLWLQESGARMPSRAKLAEVTRQLVDSGSSHARVRHDGRWLLRYRDRVDMADALPDAVVPTWFRWRGESLLEVAGHRFAFRRTAAGIHAGWLERADLLLDSGRGADRLRLQAASPSRSLKNLALERGVPPWLRQALPVLRWNAHLLYAAHFGMNHGMPGGMDFGMSHGLERGLAAAGPEGRPPLADRISIEWLAPPSWSRWL